MRWQARAAVADRDALTITYRLSAGAAPLSIEVELPNALLSRLELWLAAQGIARI